MAATNFKTENNTFRKLTGNGLTYRIPRFQRDYSWGEDEWEDLWTDILASLEGSSDASHYMGYLVLQSADDKVFDVIDGQQREGQADAHGEAADGGEVIDPGRQEDAQKDEHDAGQGGQHGAGHTDDDQDDGKRPEGDDERGGHGAVRGR